MSGGGAVGGDDGSGVAVEGDDASVCFVVLSVGDGLSDDLLVSEVDAVEDADGEADLFWRIIAKVCSGPEDIHGEALLGEFEERDDVLGEFFFGELDELLEFDGVFDLVFSGTEAAEGGEVSSAAEDLAKLMNETADVGALGAGDLERGDGWFAVMEFELVDVDEAGFAFYFDAFAGEFVEGHAVLFDGGDHGRDLHLVAAEGGGGRIDLVEGDGGDGERGDEFSVGVVAIGGFSEEDGSGVDLIV